MLGIVHRTISAHVLRNALWRTRFGGDPAAVGGRIAIAGVLPPDFRFTYPEDTQIWLLTPWSRIRPERALEYALIARLKPGVSPAEAQAELTAIARNVVRGYGIPANHLPTILARTGIMAEPVTEDCTAEVRPGLRLLAAVAALVLLIECINIGLLMMSRTVDRTGELAVRAALGAGPTHLIRMLLIEGAVLALAGGMAGAGLVLLTQPVVRTLMPAVMPRSDEIGIDAAVDVGRPRDLFVDLCHGVIAAGVGLGFAASARPNPSNPKAKTTFPMICPARPKGVAASSGISSSPASPVIAAHRG